MTNCDLEHYLLNWQTGSYLWFMAHFKRDCLFPRGETGSWNGLLVVASEKTRSRKRSWRRWQSSRAPPCTAGKMTTAVRKLNSSYTQWNYVDYVYVYLLSSIAILWFSWEVLLSTVTSMQASYAKNVNDSLLLTPVTESLQTTDLLGHSSKMKKVFIHIRCNRPTKHITSKATLNCL